MGLIKKGQSAFQLKTVALICMTIDHFGCYLTFTTNNDINSALRIIGRIAAPLFLFLLIESLRHTRSKWKFTLRLYIAAVAIQICNTLFMDYIAVGYMSSLGNILQTFTYTAFYIALIEWLIGEIKSKRILRCILPMVLMIVPFVIAWVYMFSMENSHEMLSNFMIRPTIHAYS